MLSIHWLMGSFIAAMHFLDSLRKAELEEQQQREFEEGRGQKAGSSWWRD